MLCHLFSSLPLNSIEFKPELLDEQLAKEISFISSRHKKLFVNSCSPEGRIELATWNNPNEISRAHKRGAGSRENVSEILSRHSHKLVDYTHLNVISCDPQGAHLIEDAISLERLADGCYRIGMHVVNAALLTEEFSYDRFYSYRKGSTVYSDRGVTAAMIPQQQRCSLIAGVARPAISVFLNFRSDGSELILDSERSAQIEATIIENKHQLRYEHSSTKKIANIPAALIPDLQLLERVGQQLANATHANVDAYSTLEPGSPFVSQILAYSNHLIAKELGRVQLNAIYQVGEKPTVRDFQNILKQFPAELRQKLLDSEITDIYHDDRQVHALMMRMFKYQQSLNLHNVDLSRFREQASIDPRAGSFRSGYSPYLIANTGARRLISMVAQHQINASLGICSPLSRPEVEALLRLETEHRRVAPRLRRELDLFNDLAALAKAARLAEPLEARVIDIEEGGVPVVSVQVNDRKKYFGRLEPRSQINPGRKLNVDEQVYVLPSSYNLIYDTFTFRRT